MIGQLKGQLTRHACVRGQNASCARAVVSHSAGLPVFFFFMKMYRRCLVSLSNVVIVLIKWPIDVDPGAIG